jgi:hypothetical protein
VEQRSITIPGLVFVRAPAVEGRLKDDLDPIWGV